MTILSLIYGDIDDRKPCLKCTKGPRWNRFFFGEWNLWACRSLKTRYYLSFCGMRHLTSLVFSIGYTTFVVKNRSYPPRRNRRESAQKQQQADTSRPEVACYTPRRTFRHQLLDEADATQRAAEQQAQAAARGASDDAQPVTASQKQYRRRPTFPKVVEASRHSDDGDAQADTTTTARVVEGKVAGVSTTSSKAATSSDNEPSKPVWKSTAVAHTTDRPYPRRRRTAQTKRRTPVALRRWIMAASAVVVMGLVTGAVLLNNSLAAEPQQGPEPSPTPAPTVAAPTFDPDIRSAAPKAMRLSVPDSNRVPSGVYSPVPDSASGTMAVLPGSANARSADTVYTYRFEYEKGLDIDPAVVARSIHMILNDPRGWGFGFKRVDGKADFVLSFASPATINKLCFPLNTNGQASCSIGDTVNINAKLWANGTSMWTEFGKSADDYRIYVVNHETGHFLGHNHEFCPIQGNLAPTMQQQSSPSGNNRGCIPNGWPQLDNKPAH